jgi:hypothetical protein
MRTEYQYCVSHGIFSEVFLIKSMSPDFILHSSSGAGYPTDKQRVDLLLDNVHKTTPVAGQQILNKRGYAAVAG